MGRPPPSHSPHQAPHLLLHLVLLLGIYSAMATAVDEEEKNRIRFRIGFLLLPPLSDPLPVGVWGLDTNPLQITRRRSLMCFMSVDAGIGEKKEDGQKTAGFVVYLPYGLGNSEMAVL